MSNTESAVRKDIVVEADDMVHVGLAKKYLRTRDRRLEFEADPNRVFPPLFTKMLEMRRADQLAEALQVEGLDANDKDSAVLGLAQAIVEADAAARTV